MGLGRWHIFKVQVVFFVDTFVAADVMGGSSTVCLDVTCTKPVVGFHRGKHPLTLLPYLYNRYNRLMNIYILGLGRE